MTYDRKREIKFRAWDEKRREWLDSDYHTMRLDGKEIKHKAGGRKNPILMQYTELRDRNGKEIYEGDVVEYDDEERMIDDSGVMIVGWNAEHGAWGYEYQDDYVEGCREFSSHCVGDVLVESIVIGNIYENPELI